MYDEFYDEAFLEGYNDAINALKEELFIEGYNDAINALDEGKVGDFIKKHKKKLIAAAGVAAAGGGIAAAIRHDNNKSVKAFEQEMKDPKTKGFNYTNKNNKQIFVDENSPRKDKIIIGQNIRFKNWEDKRGH